jgi:hypothetical protein
VFTTSAPFSNGSRRINEKNQRQDVCIVA